MYATRLGAWYNSISDLAGDVESAIGITRSAANGAQVVTSNVANLTSARVNVSTIALTVAGGGLLYLLLKKKRHTNPRGRRRR